MIAVCAALALAGCGRSELEMGSDWGVAAGRPEPRAGGRSPAPAGGRGAAEPPPLPVAGTPSSDPPRAGSSAGAAGTRPPPTRERCGMFVCEYGDCVRDADAGEYCRCHPGYGGDGCSTCVVYVDAVSGCRNGCGETWSSALRNLQEGIDRAAERSFCEVWVADGTYYPTTGTDRTASFQLREHVAVYGGFEGGERTRQLRDLRSQPTTLSGDIGVEGEALDNSFHVLRGADNTILHGFRIAYGQADGPAAAGQASGGGMLNDGTSPVIDSCEFAFNFALEGGAMLNTGGSPKIINSRFVNNNATIRGGAMLNDAASPEIIDSVIELSAAQAGGALYNFNGAAPRVYRSVLRHNAARTYGGAIRNQGSPLQIEESTFEKNYAADGGGAMYTDSSEWPYISGSIFAANVTDGQGGALYNVGSGMRVMNSVFVSNVAQYGGAIRNYGTTLMLINATLAANVAQADGGGLNNSYRGRPGASVTNSILWGNVPEQLSSSGEVLEVTYSTVQGGCAATGDERACTTDGTGNREADPRFELMPRPGNAEDSYDLRLASDSPCIDAARTAAAPATDLEGRTRVREADMGAYEHPN